jgi:hypothetical protein
LLNGRDIKIKFLAMSALLDSNARPEMIYLSEGPNQNSGLQCTDALPDLMSDQERRSIQEDPDL